MKHPTSRLLHAYWDRVRGARAAPERSEIDPGAIRNLLADALILSVDVAAEQAAFRLAGTRVCALFSRELRGRDLASLWAMPSADPWRLVETVALDTAGMVAGLRGETAMGETVDLELLLLPLRHRGQTQSRVLDSLSPHVVPHWLGLHPLVRLDTTSLRVLRTEDFGAEERIDVLQGLPEPANDSSPRRYGHLLVHPGGRA